MPNTVPVSPKSLEDYRKVIGDANTDEIIALGKSLRGARVLHLNATAFGGGVAELLNGMVPLLQDLGIDAQWQVMDGSEEFFNATKLLHNGMQGMYVPWDSTMGDVWRGINRSNAAALEETYDFVVVHDPQPAGLLHYTQEKMKSRRRRNGANDTKWIWRCHLDTTEALPEVWDFLRPYVELYDAAVFTRDEYVREDLQSPRLSLVPPAIDPLSTKNIDIPDETVKEILRRYQIDPERPIIAQVSRFDPWKDPLGVIDVYNVLKKKRPGLQLLMVASMANDDPEAWSFYERIVRKAGEDYDIHILTNLNGVANLEVNAFQRASQVLIQKSIREGFGLVISEGLWKEKAMVAGGVGGIPMQLVHGESGFLANTTKEYSDRVAELLNNPELGQRFGERGKEHVRQNFLITRLLRDHLSLMNSLASLAPVRSPSEAGTRAKAPAPVRSRRSRQARA
jgi:trehalose synthase